LAEAIADQHLDEGGISRPVPPAQLFELKRQVSESTAGDLWTRWAKWFFANPATRTISPSSAITVPEYVQRRIHDNTPDNLREALSLSPDNGLALARLGLDVFAQPTAAFPRHAGEAAWYSLRAMKFAPHEVATWRLRSRVHASAGQTVDALASLDRVLELEPQNLEAWKMKAELLTKSRRLDEAIACYTRLLAWVSSGTNALGPFEIQLRHGSFVNRAGLLRELGRTQEAAGDIRLACGIVERSPQASARLIDLSLYYNAGLRGGWVALDPDNGLDSLPVGVQTLAGTDFDVRGLVQTRTLGMGTDSTSPAAITAIPVGAKAHRLHLLQGAIGGTGQAGTTIAKYVIHYADGETRERPIVLEEDVLDWWAAPTGKAAPHVAWSGENASSRANGKGIHLYQTTWDNPRPEAEILNFDLVSEGNSVGLFLVAVTVE
jgi:hypothetical protein